MVVPNSEEMAVSTEAETFKGNVTWETDVRLEPSDAGSSLAMNGNTRFCLLPLATTRDCPKVKSTTYVNYGWTISGTAQCGRLVDVHKNGVLMAYALLGNGGPNSSLVRICKRTDVHLRALIKGFHGAILDLSFAFCSSPVLLAVIDSLANLHIHRVVLTEESSAGPATVQAELVFQLTHDANSIPKVLRSPCRLRWCPYLPEESDDEDGEPMPQSDDMSQLLVLTFNNIMELINVDRAVQRFGLTASSDELEQATSEKCYVRHTQDNGLDLTAATISPDGTAFAIGLSNTEVHFYVVEDFEGFKIAHTWIPHAGKVVCSIVFLDNLEHHCVEEPLWKFAVTGVEGNRELKLWSCESWTCLQIFRLEQLPPTVSFGRDLVLQQDLCGSYIFLSDINRKCLYAIEMQPGGPNGMRMTSFSEFPLLLPVLSFAIVSVKHQRLRPFSPSSNGGASVKSDQDDGGDAELSSRIPGIKANLVVINPKSLSDVELCFFPEQAHIFSGLPASGGQVVNGFSKTGKESENGESLLSSLASSGAISARDFEHREIQLAKENAERQVVSATVSAAFAAAASKSTPSYEDLVEDEVNVRRRAFASDAGENYATTEIDQSKFAQTCGAVTATIWGSSVMSDVGKRRDSVEQRQSTSPSSQEVSNILANSLDYTATNSAAASFPQKNAFEATTVTTASAQPKWSFASAPSKGPTALLQSSMVADIWKPTEMDEDRPPNAYDNFARSIPTSTLTTAHSSKHSYSQGNAECGGSTVGLATSRLSHLSLSDGGAKHASDLPESVSKFFAAASGSDGRFAVPAGNQAGATGGSGSSATVPSVAGGTQGVSNDVLLQVLAELNRVLDKMQKQEAEIHELKTTFLPHLEELKGIKQGVAHLGQQYEASENLLKGALHKSTGVQVNPEALQSLILDAIQQGIQNSVAATIQSEIRTMLPLSFTEHLKPLSDALQIQLSQKLAGFDNVVRDSITKTFKAKPFADAINLGIGQAVAKDSHAAYKDAFMKTIIPSFEATTKQLFGQMNEAFIKGTREFAEQIKAQGIQSSHTEAALHAAIIKQLAGTADEWRTGLERHFTTLMTNVQGQLQKQLQISKDGLKDVVRAVVREEVAASLREQQVQTVIEESVTRALRSSAPTPVPRPLSAIELQQRLMQLIQGGNFNDAFTQALQASDTSALLFICSKLQPTTLFGCQPLPLQQTTILSLIQHLSLDLSVYTELKIKYIEEALLVLDRNYLATRDHIPPIINKLLQNADAFVQANPTTPFLRALRMLTMAAKSLV